MVAKRNLVLWLRNLLGVSLIATIAASLGGCAAAAIGAGAAGGIAYTERGAKGDVKGGVTSVNHRAEAALKEMGIAVTGSESKDSGKENDLTGKAGSKEVSIAITSGGPDVSHVEVVAREGALKWNKDYAKSVLAKILQEG